MLFRSIQRTINIFKEQQQFIGIYEKQLSKWLTENNLTQHQQAEIERLQEQVKQCGRSVADIYPWLKNSEKDLYDL